MLGTGREQGEEEDLVTYGGQDACQVRDLGTNRGLIGELDPLGFPLQSFTSVFSG